MANYNARCIGAFAGAEGGAQEVIGGYSFSLIFFTDGD